MLDCAGSGTGRGRGVGRWGVAGAGERATRLLRRGGFGLSIPGRRVVFGWGAGAEHGEEHRIERAHVRGVRHERGARGPVEPPPRHRLHERQGLREPSGPLGGDRHAGLTQTPAERGRHAR